MSENQKATADAYAATYDHALPAGINAEVGEAPAERALTPEAAENVRRAFAWARRRRPIPEKQEDRP